jgi:hypothetical protein
MSSDRAQRVLVVLLFAGCADLDRGAPVDATAPADAGSGDSSGVDAADASALAPSFARTVHPLLVDLCGRCHSDSGQASNSTLLLTNTAERDRAVVQRFINQENPAGSRLLVKAAGSGHGGGAIIATGTPEYRTIVDWITQGSAP